MKTLLRRAIVVSALVSSMLYSSWTYAQQPFYAEYSTFLGGSGREETGFIPPQLIVEDDYTYILASTDSDDYPVSVGAIQPTRAGSRDLVISKFDPANNLVYSTYLGTDNLEQDFHFVVEDGFAYVVTSTQGVNYPVSASPAQSTTAGSRDYALTKIDPMGNMVYSTYLGGSYNETTPQVSARNGMAYVVGVSESEDFPTTPDAFQPNRSVAERDFTVSIFDTNGNLTYSTYLGGGDINNVVFEGRELQPQVIVTDNAIYIAGFSSSVAYPTTPGAAQSTYGGDWDYVVTKLTLSGSMVYSTYLGGSDREQFIINDEKFDPSIAVENDNLYLLGNTISSDYPVSAGAEQPTIGGFLDKVLTRLDPNGNIVYSTYLGGSHTEGQRGRLRVEDGVAYVVGLTRSEDFPVTPNALIPVKPGFNNTIFYTKINSSGNIVYSTYLGGSNLENYPELSISDGNAYISGYTNSSDFPVTSNALMGAQGGNFVFLKFDESDELRYSTHWRGNFFGFLRSVPVADEDKFHMLGYTNDGTHPVTADAFQFAKMSQIDLFYSKFSTCPPLPSGSIAVSPSTQDVCIRGLPTILDAPATVIDGSDLPLLYIGGVPRTQPDQELSYQWQESTSPAGPWSDAPNGTLEDYLPDIGAQDMYYRRLSINECCGDTLTSLVAVINVGNDVAPTVPGGPAVYTCPGSPVPIGGSPTAMAGDDPTLTYSWDNAGSLNDATDSNPIATVTESTIFTVTVTDGNGCTQIGQYAVEVVTADAGPDVSNCAGEGVRIGTPPVAGADSVSYAWTIVSGTPSSLSDTSLAQPIANPMVTTEYLLTQTVRLPGGTTCQTTDMVTVTPVSPPGVDFAGRDTVICNTASTVLGIGDDPNYTYIWTPGVGLDMYDEGQVTFNPTSPELPNVGGTIYDPITYTVTATRDGCSFQDQVTVSVIEARAGVDGCGPRTIGLPDRTPNLNETYSWTLVSGPNGFTGPTNTAQTTVSGSDTQTSIYRLTVCLDGVCCTDDVEVPPCGCVIDIETNTGSCPFFEPQGPTQLIATAGDIYGTDPDDFTYTWTPEVGLDQYTGRVVTLTDDVPRTYTVTMTSPADPSFNCTQDIAVNQPTYANPVFDIRDTSFCSPNTIVVGQAALPDHTYEWLGPVVLPGTSMVTISTFGTYTVTVTDTITGCLIHDTIQVTDATPIAEAGPDWVVCDNGLIELGVPDVSGGRWRYEWDPPASPWQNGTDENSPQPQVILANTQTFTLTVTDTATGCSNTDMVTITVGTDPPTLDIPDTSLCIGSSIVIGEPALPGVQYTWTPASGLSCTDCAQPTASPTTTTTYTLEAIFPGCAMVATDDVTVTVNSLDFDLGPDVTQCPSTGGIQLSGPAGLVSYEWTPNIYLDDNTIQNPTASPPTAVTYTLTGVDMNGCVGTDMITVSPLFAPPNPGNDQILCLEVGASVEIGDPNNVGTITWTATPPATTAMLSDPMSPNPIFTPTGVGTFTFTITQVSMGCSNSDMVTITVEEMTLPSFSTVHTVCMNGCVEVGVDPEPGVEYLWSPTAGVQDPTSSRTIICPTDDTGYTLTARRRTSGCTASQMVRISVDDDMAPEVSIPDVELCIGGSATLQPVVTPSGGSYQYSWTPTAGLSNPNILNPTVLGSTIGTRTYTLSVTSTDNNCGTIASVDVTTLVDAINLQIDATVDCGDDAVDLMATFGGNSITIPYVLEWTTDGDGTFEPNNNTLNARYRFGPNDVQRQNVMITGQVMGGICGISATQQIRASISACPLPLPPPPPVDTIPTLGEWGIMILGLFILIFGVVGIRQTDIEKKTVLDK